MVLISEIEEDVSVSVPAGGIRSTARDAGRTTQTKSASGAPFVKKQQASAPASPVESKNTANEGDDKLSRDCERLAEHGAPVIAGSACTRSSPSATEEARLLSAWLSCALL